MNVTTYTIKKKPYFYDAQIKRYLVQIASAFAGYQVRTGIVRDGKHRMINVPIVIGDASRVVQYMMAGGNENTVMALPVMAMDVIRYKQRADMRRAPTHVEKLFYFERAQSSTEGVLSTEPGTRVGVERYMPVPYDMGIRLSLWASNNDQGFQVVEQITSQYNPDLDILLSNSPYDWSFLSYLRFDGDVNMGRAAAGFGEGKEDAPYIFSMDFSTLVMISPPAKVLDPKPIEEIHLQFKQLNEPIDFDTMTEIGDMVITAEDE